MMDKREKIRSVALAMAEEIGAVNITREELCEKSGISDGSFFYIMGVTFGEFIAEITGDDVHTVTKKRVDKHSRKKHILTSALRVSEIVGYNHLSRQDVADQAGISLALVSHHYESMHLLRGLVLAKAIRQENLTVIAQGLTLKHPLVMAAPVELRERAAKSLL